MTQSANWHTAHVYYYSPDRSGLLLDAMEPLLYEIRDNVNAAYVVPHWRRGPHLRVTVSASADAWTRHVRPAIDRGIGGYLEQHPSRNRLDPDAAIPMHRHLAALEEEDGPLTPWIPDNTVTYPNFVSRANQMGGIPIEELVTDFYVDSNPFFLKTVRHMKDSNRPTDLTGLLLLLTTAEAIGGMRRNAGSFRSHAEGFLSDCADPAAARAVFDRQYALHRATIADLMTAMVATLNGTAATPLPLVTDWAAILRQCIERAEPTVRSGVLGLSEDARQSFLAHPTFPDYLRRAFQNESYLKNIMGSTDFHRYRMVLALSYLQLTRMGIPPRARYLLCHLAANAIEEHHGFSAIGWLNEYLDTHA
ncbi:thiopeptide maturation pyridine synthase [Streptomyces sp. NPDC088354]|uniref:thiopeptide maturation pyridine synthase n=1 Tax=Streptomyces sp. NPDC088354 TaxID=3365856 RepID=UPI003826BA72